VTWQVRHQGSPKAAGGLTAQQIAEGLRDGVWVVTDEVRGPNDSDWVPIENHPQFAEVVEDLEELAPRHHDEEARVDMNALIDVTLVLLIFFILTTTRSVAVQKIVPLPTITDAKKGTKVYQAEQVKKYMIRLQAVGEPGGALKLMLEGQPISAMSPDGKSPDKTKLRDLIHPLTRGQPPKTEMLLDAQNVSWGNVVAIQDAAKSAGIRIVHHLHRP
jgi:biopolymer transport protein ExbD